jgi:hypothetical protein
MDLGGSTYVRALFGANAVHVPAWFYVQHMGRDNTGHETVAFVGASRVETGPHPLRFGSDRTHQLVIGDIVVRPHTVNATDALRGHGLAGLVLGSDHDVAMAGDVVIAARPGGPVRSAW